MYLYLLSSRLDKDICYTKRVTTFLWSHTNNYNNYDSIRTCHLNQMPSKLATNLFIILRFIQCCLPLLRSKGKQVLYLAFTPYYTLSREVFRLFA